MPIEDGALASYISARSSTPTAAAAAALDNAGKQGQAERVADVLLRNSNECMNEVCCLARASRPERGPVPAAAMKENVYICVCACVCVFL